MPLVCVSKTVERQSDNGTCQGTDRVTEHEENLGIPFSDLISLLTNYC